MKRNSHSAFYLTKTHFLLQSFLSAEVNHCRTEKRLILSLLQLHFLHFQVRYQPQASSIFHKWIAMTTAIVVRKRKLKAWRESHWFSGFASIFILFDAAPSHKPFSQRQQLWSLLPFWVRRQQERESKPQQKRQRGKQEFYYKVE